MSNQVDLNGQIEQHQNQKQPKKKKQKLNNNKKDDKIEIIYNPASDFDEESNDEDDYEEDEKKKNKKKKTQGRVKIQMEYIPDKNRRYTTFSKRKTGIMKKVFIFLLFKIIH